MRLRLANTNDGWLSDVASVVAFHRDGATAVALNAGGRVGVSGGFDQAVSTWGLDGRPARILGMHKGRVTAVAISQDGRLAFSGSLAGDVRCWNVAEATENCLLES